VAPSRDGFYKEKNPMQVVVMRRLRISFTIGVAVMGLSIVLLILAAYIEPEEGPGYLGDVAFWIIMWPRLFLDSLLDRMFPRYRFTDYFIEAFFLSLIIEVCIYTLLTYLFLNRRENRQIK
jgi:hypothetical protein